MLVNRDAKQFMRLYNYDGSDRMEKEWRKTKSFTIKNSGYDAYFGMSSTVLSQDAEFDVDEDATKAQIKRAFVKSLKTKKLNKKVLGEFISLVAYLCAFTMIVRSLLILLSWSKQDHVE